MASYTPNLNLLMKDPVADGADTFNIETMLNENWKKIDRQVLRAIAAAAAYDAGKTYQKGDFCTQGGLLYRADQAIAQPEAWTAGHWTAISITDVIRSLTAADVGARPDNWTPTAEQVGALSKSTDVVLNTRAATYYVSPNGSDDNDGSEAKPFKTINKAISKVGNFVAGTVQIILERGTYDERVVIASKGGPGQIEIRARDAVNGSNEWIDTGVSVKSFYCIETKCKITLRGIDVYGVDNTESNCSVYVSSCTFMHLDNLRIQSATSSGNLGAVTISWGGELFFWHTDISNKHCALFVTGATAYMSNRITGSNNNIAIQCGSGQGTLGGIVFKGGSPIEGSEVTAFGGQIFD